MTMRSTRDALGNPWQTVWAVDEAEPERGAQPSIVERDTTAALAEVEAVEAVIEAARQIIHGGDSTRALGPFDMRTPTLLRLRDALARLDALTDGQGSNAAVTESESSACPCDGTDVALFLFGVFVIVWCIYWAVWEGSR